MISGLARDADLAALLQPLLDDREQMGVPGIAVGVVADGGQLTACAGVANVESSLPVCSHTVFQVGSLTKTWTAAAFFRLVEQGRLDLDRPVRDWVTDLNLADPEAASVLTPRHLLTHTGGFAGDHFLDTGADFGRDRALAAVTSALHQAPALVPVGTVSSYSNAGFYLLGRVIEIVTQRSFAEALDELLIGPLGLEHTSFFADDLITLPVAAGHTGEPPRVVRPWYRPHFSWPAGALASSLSDQLTWAQLHLSGGLELLRADTVSLMQTPQVFNSTMGDAVGMPWILHDVAGRRVVEHGGSTNGFRAQMTLVPDCGVAWVVLGNSDTSAGLVAAIDRVLRREVAGLASDTPAAVPVPERLLQDYVGRYGVASSAEVDVTADRGELVVSVGTTAGTGVRLAGTSTPDEFVAIEPDVLRGRRGLAGRDEHGAVCWLSFAGRLHPRR